MEVAKSRTMGTPSGRGTPTTNGAVESRRSVPPNGATSTLPEALTKCTETSPAAAAISAQSPTRPMWPALRRATMASPFFLHLSMPMATACGATVWPKPCRPSTTASTGVSVSILTVRSANTTPIFFHCRYRGTRTTPWLSWPVRLAETRYLPMRSDSSSEHPALANVSRTRSASAPALTVTM